MISAALGMQGLAILPCGMLPEDGYWGFVACSFVLAAAGTAFSIPFMAYIQESTAPEVLGKVFSPLMTAATLAMPAGLLVAGPAVEVIGVNAWFFWSGVVTVGAAALCYVRSRRYDRMDA